MCDSCEQLTINGVVTHEHGCPETFKDTTRECKWCGGDFTPDTSGQDCCSHSCNAAYHSIECDCPECNPLID